MSEQQTVPTLPEPAILREQLVQRQREVRYLRRLLKLAEDARREGVVDGKESAHA